MVGLLREKYFRRLIRYTFTFKPLLAVVVAMGVTGFLLAFVYPWLIGSAIDDVIVATDKPMAERSRWMLCLIAMGVATAFAHAMVTYTRGHFNVQLGNSIVTQLRRELFDHLQRLSLQFYSRERTGSIMTRLLHDVHGATAIIYGGLIVVGLDVIQLLIAFGLLMSISWKLTTACLFILPAYAVTFKIFNPFVRKASEKLHHHYCYISGNVQEQLTNISLVKSYAAEDREAERFGNDVVEHHGYVVRQSHFGHMVGAVGEILVHVGTTIVFGYGGWLALKGEMTAGDMTRFLGYIGIMYGPIQRFAGLNMIYQNSLTAMRRVFRVFDITPKITEKSHAIQEQPRRADVRFENVKFRYIDDSDEARMSLDEDVPVDPDAIRRAPWVLNGINLHARPGERVALVGPSGSGKTTLVSLLPRLYDVGEGRITIDGHDIRDYALKTLRTTIGIVQQDAFIFSGSIRDNISYGRPGATTEQIVAAAKAANAHTFIMGFPQGYDTKLGERGVNLSGGQKQRVSIARALLKDPKILILDEATSALDAESESLVQQALDRLMANRTCFIVAHRLSTVRNADRICVLDGGRVVEEGTHDDLLDQDGIYAKLIRHQFHNGRTKADRDGDMQDEAELELVGAGA